MKFYYSNLLSALALSCSSEEHLLSFTGPFPNGKFSSASVELVPKLINKQINK